MMEQEVDRNIPVKEFVEGIIKANKVVVFSKSWCPFCVRVCNHLREISVNFKALQLDLLGEYGESIQKHLHEKTGQSTVPSVFINGTHVGGCDTVLAASASGKLADWLEGIFEEYEYDLVIIGGGSGGIAAAKEAAKYSSKVALCDFVKPSPQGTTWGIGGTCVNVGCIPKKLMHAAAIMKESLGFASQFGFELDESHPHNWGKMVSQVQNYIKSLNWNYRKELKKAAVKYYNAYAMIVDPHKAQLCFGDGSEKFITAQNFIVACGGRPTYLDIPGAKEYCITSDDIFSLNEAPGKTLVIGASYIALECAGFLRSLGTDVTVMVRSILLRSFDRDMANRIGLNLEGLGVKFFKECSPVKIDLESGDPRVLRVEGACKDGSTIVDTFNTVLLAVGREPSSLEVLAPSVGVKVNPGNNKIIVDRGEGTNIRSVYAVGDVVDGKPELTPVAIKAGVLLARRLFGKAKTFMDYTFIPTTVFTPIEYGCVGMSEELAIESFGETNIEVFHTLYKPLEWELSNAASQTKCYAKLICMKTANIGPSTVIGLHVLGPNAGEITQGFALALKLGAKKSDFDSLVGIHPTSAEVFVDLQITKSSGKDINKGSC